MPLTQDIHRTSSFPSILDSYVPPECLKKVVSVGQAGTQKMKKMQMVTKVRESILHPGSADKMTKLKQKARLDQHHLESYHRLHRLKHILSHRYSKLLTEKVQRQRNNMQQISCDNREDTIRHTDQRAGRRALRKLIDSTHQQDNARLKPLPQSRHYLIQELQKQLDQHECPEKQKVVMYTSTERLKRVKLRDKDEEHAKPSLPKILISKDNTSEQQEHILETTIEGGELLRAPVLHSKHLQEQDESKLTFPRVFSQKPKMPRFTTLQPSFLDTFKTNILLSKTGESLHKSEAATLIRHKIHLMHSLSLSHMAQSQRLLDKTGLAIQHNIGFSIKDVLEHMYPDKASTKEPSHARDSPQHFEHHPDNSEHVRESENTPTKQIYSVQPSEVKRAGKSISQEMPLSMRDMSALTIAQDKHFDKNTWTNYALDNAVYTA